MNDCFTQNWFKRFKSGEYSFEIKSRSGLQSVADYETLIQNKTEKESDHQLSGEQRKSKGTI